jgi:hypothetical protein
MTVRGFHSSFNPQAGWFPAVPPHLRVTEPCPSESIFSFKWSSVISVCYFSCNRTSFRLSHLFLYIDMTKRHGLVANTPASYWGSPGFEFLPGDRLSFGVSWFSSVPPGKLGDYALKLDQRSSFHILSNSSSTLRSFIGLYIFWVTEKA